MVPIKTIYIIKLLAMLLTFGHFVLQPISAQTDETIPVMLDGHAVLSCPKPTSSSSSPSSSSSSSSTTATMWVGPGGKTIVTRGVLTQAVDQSKYTVIAGKAGAGPTLLINRVGLVDDGLYRCLDVNRLGLHSVNVTVLVSVQSLTLTFPPGQINEGSVVTVTCVTEGSKPAPDITWIKTDNNGRVTRLSGSNTDHVHTNGTVKRTNSLSITVDRSDYLATYVCTASVSIFNKHAAWTPDVLLSPMEPWLLSDKMKYVDGDIAHFQCVTSGSRPAAQITWLLNNQSVSSSGVVMNRNKRDGNGTYTSSSMLTIVMKGDMNGVQIICSVTNAVLTSQRQEPRTAEEKLVVEYRPVISINTSTSEVREGEDVKFTCRTDAEPPVGSEDVYLALNEQFLPQARLQKNGDQFVVKNISRVDRGQYQCVAKNSRGTAVSPPVHLTVQFSPVCISDNVKKVYAALGATVSIPCVMEAFPHDVTITWLRRSTNKTLRKDTVVTWSANDVAESKFIYRARRYEDIVCYARNSAGDTSAPCVVRLTPPQPPSSPHDCLLLRLPDTSRQLRCTPGQAGESPAVTFTLRVQGPKKEEREVTGEEPVFALDELDEGREYNLTVCAVSTALPLSPVCAPAITLQPEAVHMATSSASAGQEPTVIIVVCTVLGSSSVAAVVFVFIVCRRRKVKRKPQAQYDEEFRGDQGREEGLCEDSTIMATTSLRHESSPPSQHERPDTPDVDSALLAGVTAPVQDTDRDDRPTDRDVTHTDRGHGHRDSDDKHTDGHHRQIDLDDQHSSSADKHTDPDNGQRNRSDKHTDLDENHMDPEDSHTQTQHDYLKAGKRVWTHRNDSINSRLSGRSSKSLSLTESIRFQANTKVYVKAKPTDSKSKSKADRRESLLSKNSNETNTNRKESVWSECESLSGIRSQGNASSEVRGADVAGKGTSKRTTGQRIYGRKYRSRKDTKTLSADGQHTRNHNDREDSHQLSQDHESVPSESQPPKKTDPSPQIAEERNRSPKDQQQDRSVKPGTNRETGTRLSDPTDQATFTDMIRQTLYRHRSSLLPGEQGSRRHSTSANTPLVSLLGSPHHSVSAGSPSALSASQTSEASGKPQVTSDKHLMASGKHLIASDKHLIASDKHLRASGKHLMASGRHLTTLHKLSETSDIYDVPRSTGDWQRAMSLLSLSAIGSGVLSSDRERRDDYIDMTQGRRAGSVPDLDKIGVGTPSHYDDRGESNYYCVPSNRHAYINLMYQHDQPTYNPDLTDEAKGDKPFQTGFVIQHPQHVRRQSYGEEGRTHRWSLSEHETHELLSFTPTTHHTGPAYAVELPNYSTLRSSMKLPPAPQLTLHPHHPTISSSDTDQTHSSKVTYPHAPGESSPTIRPMRSQESSPTYVKMERNTDPSDTTFTFEAGLQEDSKKTSAGIGSPHGDHQPKSGEQPTRAEGAGRPRLPSVQRSPSYSRAVGTRETTDDDQTKREYPSPVLPYLRDYVIIPTPSPSRSSASSSGKESAC